MCDTLLVVQFFSYQLSKHTYFHVVKYVWFGVHESKLARTEAFNSISLLREKITPTGRCKHRHITISNTVDWQWQMNSLTQAYSAFYFYPWVCITAIRKRLQLHKKTLGLFLTPIIQAYKLQHGSCQEILNLLISNGISIT